jgi:hypothetical protein
MAGTRTPDLIDLSNEVWSRLWSRFEGLTDEEYLWEPAPGCWSIRRRDDGRWTEEFTLPPPEPAPFTTIAWRMWHLIDMYGENRAPTFLGVQPYGTPVGCDDPDGRPPTAAAPALALLDLAHARWDAHLAQVDDDLLGEPIGPIGGHFARHTKGAFVLHMLDEFIHHGAEISLLRDLWRWQHPLHDDGMLDRVMRGDPTVVGELRAPDSGDATRWLTIAASYGRWDLVRELIGAGVSPSTEGRTPLHSAAIAGELEIVRLLLGAGADPTARDPEFRATPVEWARFLDRDEVVAILESPTSR